MVPTGSDDFLRVDLANNPDRRGFLTHAGFLTATSHPRHTSPVNRGKWVMDQLMCELIPPPPPTVNVAEFSGEVDPNASLREKLEVHRANPSCAGCHSLMDPIGFAFEHYDPVGVHRALEANGAAIDSSGQLPDGRSFSGARELIDVLAADPRFGRCVARKLFTYAMGRPPLADSLSFDPSTLDALTELTNSGAGLNALVSRLVHSTPFTHRRASIAVSGAE
jgi:hypothetical protein